MSPLVLQELGLEGVSDEKPLFHQLEHRSKALRCYATALYYIKVCVDDALSLSPFFLCWLNLFPLLCSDTPPAGENVATRSQGLLARCCFQLSVAGEIFCEPPNNRLHKFRGRLDWNEKSYSLDNDKIALRVSHLASLRVSHLAPLVLKSSCFKNDFEWGGWKGHSKVSLLFVVSIGLFPWQRAGWIKYLAGV